MTLSDIKSIKELETQLSKELEQEKMRQKERVRTAKETFDEKVREKSAYATQRGEEIMSDKKKQAEKEIEELAKSYQEQERMVEQQIGQNREKAVVEVIKSLGE